MVKRLVFTSVCVAILLSAGCVPIQPAPEAAPAAEAAGGEAAAVPVFEVSDAGITGPASLPAGLLAIDISNVGTAHHAAIFRRLNDDVTLEQWQAAVRENPLSAFPMVRLFGGPGIAPGGTAQMHYHAEPGLHIVVDNTVRPPQAAVFEVTEGAGEAAAEPEAAVNVVMSDGAFDVPATVSAGAQVWRIENAGMRPHLFAIIQMNEGSTLEEAAAWLAAGGGDRGGASDGAPFAWPAVWYTVSPGTHAWTTITLEPGAYHIVDFLPDPTNPGTSNMQQGMVAEFTVE